MTSPYIRIPKPKMTKKQASFVATIEAQLNALTPEQLHQEIITAVPEFQRLGVKLIRSTKGQI